MRTHAKFHRHQYRGDIWFILQDTASGRSHRFNGQAYLILSIMNGERTVQNIWDAINTQLGDEAPSQDEMIQLLGRLHSADLLQCDITPDSAELFRRYKRQQRADWKQRLWTPLAVRFPLLDPDSWLQRLLPLVRPLFSRASAAIWFITVIVAAVLAATQWSALTSNLADRILSPQNLLLLWLTYPLVKFLHELGHAFAVKVWGGEVHEMGIMFLVLMPIPYVDASASSVFRDKHKRMIVGAAGMAVELFLASIALFVWMTVEPGIIKTIAFNIMLIGGVSTLLFNGNPLLRFDAYYILSDAIEIPNLASRANQQVGYLIKRHLFGMQDVQSPSQSSSEFAWLLGYSLSSFTYRMIIVFVIILFVAGKFFMVGVLLATWATVTQLLVPLAKQVKFLINSPEVQPRRIRALTVSSGADCMLFGFIFLLPVPLWTMAEGVVWLPERSQVRAGADCFVEQYLAQPNQHVQVGNALIQCVDPMLGAKIKVVEAQLRELQVRYNSASISDRVQAAIIKEEIATVQAGLYRELERMDSMTIRSVADGIFVVPRSQDLPDQFVRQGDLLGYVINSGSTIARVVVPQRDIGLVRQGVEQVEIRLVDLPTKSFVATLQREVPAASNRLPSRALGTSGGGATAVEAGDNEGVTAKQKIFQFDLQLPIESDLAHPGKRVYVRFDHGYESMGKQWYRRARQMLLSRFDV